MSPTTLWLVTAESPSPLGPASSPLAGTGSDPSSNSARDDAAAGAVTRYRCAACGNLTRFDVVTDRRTRAFHHYSVGGDLSVEDVEVLDESVEEVSCRWCGHGDAIEALTDEAPVGE
jgi:hypothetical protein